MNHKGHKVHRVFLLKPFVVLVSPFGYFGFVVNINIKEYPV